MCHSSVLSGRQDAVLHGRRDARRHNVGRETQLAYFLTKPNGRTVLP